MERATKLFLIGWACAAIAAEAWLLRGWRGLPMLTLGALAAGALLAIWDRRAVGIVLVCAYVFPAIIRVGHGEYNGSYAILWASALLGVVAPDGLRTPWHIPARWRGARTCYDPGVDHLRSLPRNGRGLVTPRKSGMRSTSEAPSA